LNDLISLAVSSYPPPAATDEVAMTAYVSNLAGKGTTIVYDIWATEPVAAMALAAVPFCDVTDGEIELAYAQCCAGKFGAPGKIGDGKILEWLKSLPWSTIISFIIAIIPK
jgi:hypothetical protein